MMLKKSIQLLRRPQILLNSLATTKRTYDDEKLVPVVDNYERDKTPYKNSTMGIIGVPFSKGQARTGVEHAPDTLREHGLEKILVEASNGTLDIKDYGNLQFEPDPTEYPEGDYGTMLNFSEFMGMNKALIKKMQEILSENDHVLTIGGDHAISFGSVAGHLQHTPDLSLIWVDAHSDINLHNTTSSGNTHGMPVSFLLRELRPYWQHINIDQIAPNCLPADQLVYIALRSIDPFEVHILDRLQLQVFAMNDIDREGMSKIMEKALDKINPKNKIHVSFDIDAIDDAYAPSTGTTEPGGLTLREGITIMEMLRATNRVQGIDLAEFNPRLGKPKDVEKTLQTTFELLKAISGKKRAGNSENVNGDFLNKIK